MGQLDVLLVLLLVLLDALLELRTAPSAAPSDRSRTLPRPRPRPPTRSRTLPRPRLRPPTRSRTLPRPRPRPRPGPPTLSLTLPRPRPRGAPKANGSDVKSWITTGSMSRSVTSGLFTSMFSKVELRYGALLGLPGNGIGNGTAANESLVLLSRSTGAAIALIVPTSSNNDRAQGRNCVTASDQTGTRSGAWTR